MPVALAIGAELRLDAIVGRLPALGGGERLLPVPGRGVPDARHDKRFLDRAGRIVHHGFVGRQEILPDPVFQDPFLDVAVAQPGETPFLEVVPVRILKLAMKATLRARWSSLAIRSATGSGACFLSGTGTP